jgi:hypothetical protein
MKRRTFLQAALTAAAGVPAAILGAKAGRASKKAKPRADEKYYRVTCEEVPTGRLAVWLGENKVWAKPLRELSWSTNDLDYLPAMGEILEIEHDHASGIRQKFDVRVTRIETNTGESLGPGHVLLTQGSGGKRLFEGTDGRL